MKRPESLKDILNVLKDSKAVLCDKYGVSDIAVFGSYVRNEQRRKSDLDVFVDLKTAYKTFDNFMNLKFYLEQITGKKVDLVIKESIRKELKPRILKEAVYA